MAYNNQVRLELLEGKMSSLEKTAERVLDSIEKSVERSERHARGSRDRFEILLAQLRADRKEWEAKKDEEMEQHRKSSERFAYGSREQMKRENRRLEEHMKAYESRTAEISKQNRWFIAMFTTLTLTLGSIFCTCSYRQAERADKRMEYHIKDARRERKRFTEIMEGYTKRIDRESRGMERKNELLEDYLKTYKDMTGR